MYFCAGSLRKNQAKEAGPGLTVPIRFPASLKEGKRKLSTEVKFDTFQLGTLKCTQ